MLCVGVLVFSVMCWVMLFLFGVCWVMMLMMLLVVLSFCSVLEFLMILMCLIIVGLIVYVLCELLCSGLDCGMLLIMYSGLCLCRVLLWLDSFWVVGEKEGSRVLIVCDRFGVRVSCWCSFCWLIMVIVIGSVFWLCGMCSVFLDILMCCNCIVCGVLVVWDGIVSVYRMVKVMGWIVDMW